MLRFADETAFALVEDNHFYGANFQLRVDIHYKKQQKPEQLNHPGIVPM
jgi:hypothetical protein